MRTLSKRDRTFLAHARIKHVRKTLYCERFDAVVVTFNTAAVVVHLFCGSFILITKNSAVADFLEPLREVYINERELWIFHLNKKMW